MPKAKTAKKTPKVDPEAFTEEEIAGPSTEPIPTPTEHVNKLLARITELESKLDKAINSLKRFGVNMKR